METKHNYGSNRKYFLIDWSDFSEKYFCNPKKNKKSILKLPVVLELNFHFFGNLKNLLEV